MDPAPPAEAAPKLLLNASMIVFLFRALTASTGEDARDKVSRQLLNLLREFVQFESGTVFAVGWGGDLRADISDDRLYEHLVEHGPLVSPGLTAVPIYARRELAGALVLRGMQGEIDTLSAIASLASVAVENAREVERVRRDCVALEQRLAWNGGLIGDSPAIVKLLDRVSKVAQRDTTVLIQGETGTGKELVARLIHRNSSRADGPFVAINCAAIAESLLESELFGHEKGAFTGAAALKKGKVELAEGGTLFLDEVGELALPLQAKLLRVLQQREVDRVGGTRSVRVDLRVLAATNRDLSAHVRNGLFRQDLFHRLNVITLRTPPLRERKEDISVLANHFLVTFGSQCSRPGIGLSAEALRCLEAYDWPGNVRELENAVEHAVVLGDGNVVLPSDLPESILHAAAPDDVGAFQSTVQDAKRESILRAYQQAGGDYKGAAQILGLHPNYLLRLVKNLGLREALKK